MTGKKTITDNQIKQVTRRRKKLTLHKLLRASTINTVLSEVDALPELSNVIILASSGAGPTIHHTGLETDTIIAALEKAKIQLIDDELFQDDDDRE